MPGFCGEILDGAHSGSEVARLLKPQPAQLRDFAIKSILQ